MSKQWLRRCVPLLGSLVLGCTETAELDYDGDGWDDALDCAPADPDVYPGAPDSYGDGIDSDCDLCPAGSPVGAGDGVDKDCDGYPGNDDLEGPLVSVHDCDDLDAAVNPGVLDEGCDDVDSDCDGALGGDEVDDDGDGLTECAGDCDDTDAAVTPDAEESCDGLDNDCDGVPAADEVDGDGDGWMGCEGDCADADAAVHPGAEELCNGLDDDCDGALTVEEEDGDLDGQMACEGDCDDSDASLDGIDHDQDGWTSCDGDCDDFNSVLDLDDADGDLASTCDGDCDDSDAALNPNDADADGFDTCAGDCDDLTASVYPGAPDVCDGVQDNDCDGVTDASESDGDGDGYSECDLVPDCDNTDANVYPGAPDSCDGVLDNDCDGVVDAQEVDADGDGSSPCDGDCDDSDAANGPGNQEICDLQDNDCDGLVDDADATVVGLQLWYRDADSDGYGDPLYTYLRCFQPADAVVNNWDCDDNDPGQNGDDQDGDGLSSCEGDCDDQDATTHPGAADVCDGVTDNDCDGVADPQEADGDGDGASLCDSDCDDGDPSVYPTASEICDGLDNNCNGVVPSDERDDDGDGIAECEGDCDDQDAAMNLADVDGDGWSSCDGDCDDGDAALQLDDVDVDGWSTCAGDCDDQDAALQLDDLDADGWTTCDGDCNDLRALAYPGATEQCGNDQDDNCDDVADEDCYLLLTSPTAGEVWAAESSHYVTWSATDAYASNPHVTVDLSLNGGLSWTTIDDADTGLPVAAVETEIGETEMAQWTVPDSQVTNAVIRVWDNDDPSIVAQSGEFAIVATLEDMGYQWQQVTGAAAFAARDGAGALVFEDAMWLLGGWNPNDPVEFPLVTNNEVWTSTDGATWTLVNDIAGWEPRHTAGYGVFLDKMWVVGGDPIQGHFQPDIWSTEDGGFWTQELAVAPWGYRVLHHTVVYDDQLWVMGGQTLPQYAPEIPDSEFYNDVWVSSDGVNWTEVTAAADWEPRGMIGGSAVHDGRMWLLGGGTYDTPAFPTRNYYNDVWSSTDGANWDRHVEYAPWGARQYHDVAVFDDKLWVMEGYDGSSNLNDVWYSPDGVNWYEVTNTPWPTRHAASVFVYDDALWMVAGNNMTPDVWKLTDTIP